MPKIQNTDPAPVAEPEEPKATKKEKPVDYLSGFCQSAQQAERVAGRLELATPPEEWHAKCRGAVTNGAGKTVLCRCPCHADQRRCHECGHVAEADEAWDEDRRRCADRTACADQIKANIARTRATNPTIIQIREIKEEAARKRAEEAAKEAKKRLDAPPRADGPEAAPRPTKGRVKGSPQRCHCGCGGMTKGGQFMMGHDMRLKGQLFKAARGQTGEAAADAAIEIRARGWSEVGIDPGLLSGPVEAAEVIRDAVERRYGNG